MDLVFYPLMVVALLAPAAFFWRRHEFLEGLAMGALVSLAGWAALAYGRFLVLLPPSTARGIGIAALASALVATAAVGRLAGWSHPAVLAPPAGRRSIIAILAGAALLVLGLEAVLPHFGIANLSYDWWEHFDLARFYHAPADLARVYRDGYTVTSRTPLFNLLTSLPLTVFGDRFSVFQVATAAIGWLWVIPALLLARRVLADQGPRLVSLLTLSPLVLFATAYGWPKGLVTFFVLLALDRFLAFRKADPAEAGPLAVQLGLASGLTLMTHEGFVGYLIPLYALLAFDVIARRRRWTSMATACLVGGLAALPWYAWAIAQYGVRAALIGYPEPGYASPGLWLLDHVVIVVSSAVPITILFHAFGRDPVQQLLVAYLRTAVGLLGAAFLLRLLARVVRRPVAAGPRTQAGPLIAFAVAGTLTTTLLLNGWANGWASAEAVLIPAMVALLIVAVARAPLTQAMAAIAAAECLLVVAVAIAYMWSPASSGEPNAQLAVITQTRFLGHDTWGLALPLMLAGAALSLSAAVGWRLAAQKKEPRAGWHEAPSVF